MSVQSVEARALAVAEARATAKAAEVELHHECRAAVHGGVPVAAVARAAGVARITMYEWLKDGTSE